MCAKFQVKIRKYDFVGPIKENSYKFDISGTTPFQFFHTSSKSTYRSDEHLGMVPHKIFLFLG
jgi:hypothetical protein